MSGHTPGPLPLESASIAPFQIGPFQVRPSLNEIEGTQGVAQIQPRAMYVLVCLAARHGGLVSRTELLDTVWGDTVVCEDAVTRVISDLRSVLGDEPAAPRFIGTIRKGGYRLLVPLAGDISRVAVPAPSEKPITPAAISSPQRKWRLTSIVAAGLMLLAIASVWQFSRFQQDPGQASGFEGIPLTTMPGIERDPALDPDGLNVAFAWIGPDDADSEIYLMGLGESVPHRLTPSPGADQYPTWSPDGLTVAFVNNGDRPGIYQVPAAGGRASLLLAWAEAIYGMSWSPSGKNLVFASPESGTVAGRLRILELGSGRVRDLIPAEAGSYCDLNPVYDPQGRRLAFVRANEQNVEDCWLLDLETGTMGQVSHGLRHCFGLAWSPDGEELVIGAAPRGELQLWRLNLSQTSLTPIGTNSLQASSPTVARRGGNLVFSEQSVQMNIYLLKCQEPGVAAGMPLPLTPSTRQDFQASFSPNDSLIAFVSTRSGGPDLWICDTAGQHLRRLAAFPDHLIRRPTWSGDGTRLAFNALSAQGIETYLMDAGGGVPHRVPAAGAGFFLYGWGAPNQLVGETASLEGWHLAQVDLEGSKQPLPLPVGAGFRFVDAQGRLYYSLADQTGLWRQADGVVPDEMLLDAAQASELHLLAPWSGGCYAIVSAHKGNNLIHVSFATGERRTVMELNDLTVTRMQSAASGKQVLLDCMIRAEQDLVLVQRAF